ncbi:MAG: hypothetical protein IPG93_06240 [Burkholderiales bacterium]|nr:hypothetical protein [Burkholderiales bacterium]
MNFFQSPSRALKQAFGVRPRVVAPLSGPDSRDDSRPGASSLGAATAELLRPGSAAAVASLQPTGAIVGHIGGYPSEAGFVALQVAFRASGGLARGDDLVRWLQGHSNGDVASLARLIVTAELFSFEWRDTFWVPMFQFDLDDLSIKRGPRKVVIELAAEFDGWNLAAWFAQPNSWLNNAHPVDLLDHNLAGVLRAARADCHVAAG